MSKKNGVARGGRPARTRTEYILANPDGNRAERRAAAKVARMNAKQAAQLPMASETPQPGRWTERGGATRNGQ